MSPQIEQQIIAKLRDLDDFSLQEVLDFADFLHHRQRKQAANPADKKKTLLGLSAWDEEFIQNIESIQGIRNEK